MTTTKTIAAAAVLIAGAGAVQATELKLSDQFPVQHTITTQGTQAFFDTIAANPDADLTIRHFPAGQLGKPTAQLDVVKDRIAEIAVVGISYVPERLPLSTMMELPQLYGDSFDGYVPIQHMMKTELNEAEFRKAGIRPLWVIVTPQYQLLLTRDEPIAGIEDLSGVKARVAGATAELVASALGMTPVRMPAPDLYVALERGTLDAAIYSLSVLKSYKLEEVTNSYTSNAALGGVAFMGFINEDVWQSLTPEQQALLEEAGDAAGFATACALAKNEQATIAELEGMGKTVYELDEATQAQFASALESVSADWRATMDERGIPGSRMLDVFQATQEKMRADGSIEAAAKECGA